MSLWKRWPAALVLSTVSALAQMPGPGGPPEDLGGPPMNSPGDARQPIQGVNARRLLARLSKELKLSDEQKTRIKPILDNEQQQTEALVKSSAPRLEQNQKIDEIEQNGWAEIRPVLSVPQRKKLDVLAKKTAERRERAVKRAEDEEDGPPPPPNGVPPQ